jgi:hypothetical protein
LRSGYDHFKYSQRLCCDDLLESVLQVPSGQQFLVHTVPQPLGCRIPAVLMFRRCQALHSCGNVHVTSRSRDDECRSFWKGSLSANDASNRRLGQRSSNDLQATTVLSLAKEQHAPLLGRTACRSEETHHSEPSWIHVCSRH